MATRAQELAQLRRWKLRPEYRSLGVFNTLLENEFLSPEEHEARMAPRIRGVVRFAVENTAYYARLFKRFGLRPNDIGDAEDFTKVPVLTKHDLLECHDDLRAPRLPPGETIWGPTQSSGTTGRRVTVWHTQRSNSAFAFLAQRAARWRRLDPMDTRLDVRQADDVFAGLSYDERTEYRRLPGWRYLGRFFHTGPEVLFPVSSPMERQIAILQDVRPHYALSFPGVFEEWLFANGGHSPVDSLKCLMGVGSQLTPSMRRQLEQGFGVPIHMSYGLNEIGAVAVQCEQGRYHVNTEHCLVQIADAEGRPCAPGEVGHVLVTGLSNCAMPLLRYDTGDLAEAVEGPCGCGRTLPSFGELAGRYRRYTGLPVGTRERVRAIRTAIEDCPPSELRFLRRYQIHQDRQNRFALRLRAVAPIPDAFRARVQCAWAPFADSPLAIVEFDAIEAGPSGKPLDFVSDFHTDSACASEPGSVSRSLADT